MDEEFLQFVWRYGLVKSEQFLENGKCVDIIKFGDFNTDSGPDFINARLRIDGTVWAGNVEVHVNASDWYLHRHHENKGYENVILHVVWKYDKEVFRMNGEPVPVLSMRNIISNDLQKRYLTIKQNLLWIPCERSIRNVDEVILRDCIDNAAIERIRRKMTGIRQLVNFSFNNWEYALFILIARYFGARVNTLAFELLAKSIPYNLILRWRNDRFRLEALFFGQSGLLNSSFSEAYPQSLRKEYEFLRFAYDLKPVEAHIWKFLRLRPSSFPHIRISQLADLAEKHHSLFAKVCEVKNVTDFYDVFSVTASNYWKKHYCFDKNTNSQYTKTSNSFVERIIINAIVPVLYCWAHLRGDQSVKSRMLQILKEIPSESNTIIRSWKRLDVIPENAYDSQALIELKEQYCDHRRCLKCKLGFQYFTSQL